MRIVASSQSHVRSMPVEVNGRYRFDIIDGIEYLWLRTASYTGNGVRRALNIFQFVLQLRQQSDVVTEGFVPDVVIASSTYPLDIYPAKRLADQHDAKLVWEVHDLWPLSPIELSGMSPRHPFAIAIQRAEDRACREADVVVSILPHSDRHLIERGMDPAKYVHVPNGIHTEQWNVDLAALPTDHRSVLSEIRASGSLIVGYAGAHGVANALDSLLDAAEMTADLAATYVLVGQGPEKRRLQRVATERGLSNVRFLIPCQKRRCLRSSIPWTCSTSASSANPCSDSESAQTS